MILRITEWTIEDHPDELCCTKVVERRASGLSRYAVVAPNGSVLNKKGKFEREPRPSSRTESFLARCRFASPEDAFQAYMKWKFDGQ